MTVELMETVENATEWVKCYALGKLFVDEIERVKSA